MLPQSSINYYSPQLSENCESLTANNVLKEIQENGRSSKIYKDIQKYSKISKTFKAPQRHPKISNNFKDIQSIPRDTQRYPIFSKTSKATPEKSKKPKILCEIYNYLSWSQRKDAFPDG